MEAIFASEGIYMGNRNAWMHLADHFLSPANVVLILKVICKKPLL